jgi:hypothetical protein
VHIFLGDSVIGVILPMGCAWIQLLVFSWHFVLGRGWRLRTVLYLEYIISVHLRLEHIISVCLRRVMSISGLGKLGGGKLTSCWETSSASSTVYKLFIASACAQRRLLLRCI